MGEDMLVLEVERGVMKSSYCIAMQYFANNCPLAVGGAIMLWWFISLDRCTGLNHGLSWYSTPISTLNAQLLNALALRIDD